MKNSTKVAGSVTGSLIIASSAALGIVSALPSIDAGAEESQAFAIGQEQIAQETTQTTKAANVEGIFSFDQNAVTPSGKISSVFVKATAALCQSMPHYLVNQANGVISITGASGNSFEATVSNLASEEDPQTSIMACSCSSNVAGGGAVANAEVSGVTLATIAMLAG